MVFSEDDMNDQHELERRRREEDIQNFGGVQETVPEYEQRISKLLADARGLIIDWKMPAAFEDGVQVAAGDELFELIELVEEEMEEAYNEPYDRDDDVIGEYEMYGPDRPTREG